MLLFLHKAEAIIILVTFPKLGEVAFRRRCPMCPRGALSFGHQGYVL